MRQLWRILAFAVVVVFVPSAARSEVGQFNPTFYDFGGLLELNALSNINKNNTNGNGLHTSDTSYQEKLTLLTAGFVYHPRFIVFTIKLSGILGQEKWDIGTGKAPWTTIFDLGHEVHIKLLPEHPYNLELYSIQDVTYVPGGIQTGQTTINQNGAIFNYYKDPFSANASYLATNSKSDAVKNDINAFTMSGSHSIPLSTTAGTYSHITANTNFLEATSANTTNMTKDIYTLSHTLRYKGLILTSNATLNNTDLQSSPPSVDTTTKFFVVTESLNYQLPWNFYSSLLYNHFYTSLDTTTEGASSAASTTSNNEGFNLGHQLFQSLASNYNLSVSNSKSSDNATDDTVTNTLAFNYTKKIPVGFLNIGLIGGYQTEKRNGALSVINEAHPATLLAPNNMFTLNNVSANIPTIVVRVRIPGTDVDYVLPQIYYSVGLRGNSPLITIIDLPVTSPPVKQLDPNYIYAFTVSYSLVPENFKLKTVQKGFNLQFSLFNNIINPYYRYLSSRQTVLSGTLIGGPDSSVSNSIGFMAAKRPFTLLIDYTKLDSTALTSSQFLMQLSYLKDIFENTTLSADLRYLSGSFLTPSGLNSSAPSLSYTEVDKTVSLGLTRLFPLYNISASVSGSYGTSRSLSNATLVSGNGVLTWRTGQLTLSAGATVSNATTTFSVSSTGKNDVEHQYYYLRLRRTLF